MNSRSAGACFPKHVQFNSYIIRWRREREERVKYRICITKNANQMHRQETYSQRARHGDHSGLKMCSVWRITLILWDFHSGSGWFDAIASSLWMFCKLTREMRKGRGSEKTKCRKWKKNHFFFGFFSRTVLYFHLIHVWPQQMCVRVGTERRESENFFHIYKFSNEE